MVYPDTDNHDGSEEMDTEDQMFEIDGQKLTLDELKAGYLRQSDYTKKTQELATKRKELEKMKPAEMTEEEKNMLEWIKRQGFVSKDELEKTAYQQTQEIELRELVANAPQLKNHEAAIRRLQQVEGGSYEEIIQKYGFMEADKLAKARESCVKLVGEKQRETKEKTLSDLSPAEYEQWKKENLGGSRFNKSRTI